MLTMEAAALLLQFLAFGHNFIILTRRQIFNFIFICSMYVTSVMQVGKAHRKNRKKNDIILSIKHESIKQANLFVILENIFLIFIIYLNLTLDTHF